MMRFHTVVAQKKSLEALEIDLISVPRDILSQIKPFHNTCRLMGTSRQISEGSLLDRKVDLDKPITIFFV